MNRSRNASVLFVIAGSLLIGQLGISAMVFEDTVGAILAFGMAFIMFVGAAFSWSGKLMAVSQKLYEIDGPGQSTVSVYRDTGLRVQMVPCWGVLWGVITIVIVVVVGAPVWDVAIALLLPGLLAGILGILASLVFVVEYRGDYTRRDESRGEFRVYSS
ncbi:MAG: hypothetical protein ACP6KW_10765 [Candidatus Thorarchaeota archaeon]